MTETYFAIEPVARDPKIHRLGTPVAADGRGPRSDSFGGLKFAFAGTPEPSSEQEKSQDMRFALEKVYEEITRKSAKDVDDEELKKKIAGHYRDLSGDQNSEVVLTIFKIDPKNRSDSFGKALDKLETFTTESKHALILDAYHQLSTLDHTKAGERDRLCDALVHMRERGAFEYSQLEGDPEQWLGNLLNDRPDIRNAMASAQNRYTTQRKSLERKYVYQAFKKGEEAMAPGNAKAGNLPPQGSVRKLGAARQGALPPDKVSEPAHDVAKPAMQPMSRRRQALIDARQMASEAARSIVCDPFTYY